MNVSLNSTFSVICLDYNKVQRNPKRKYQFRGETERKESHVQFSLLLTDFLLKIIFVPLQNQMVNNLFFVLSLDTWFSIRDNEWVRNLVRTSRWLIYYTHQKQGEWLDPRCTDKKRQEHHDKPQVFEVLHVLKKDYLKKCLDVVSWVWLKQYI